MTYVLEWNDTSNGCNVPKHRKYKIKTPGQAWSKANRATHNPKEEDLHLDIMLKELSQQFLKTQDFDTSGCKWVTIYIYNYKIWA